MTLITNDRPRNAADPDIHRLRRRGAEAFGRQRALALLADIRDASTMAELTLAGPGAARRRVALGPDVVAGEALERLEALGVAPGPRAAA